MTNAYVICESNLNLAKKCLSLIRDIAARGASSNEELALVDSLSESMAASDHGCWSNPFDPRNN